MTDTPTPPPPTKEELQEDDYMRQGAKWGTIIGFVIANMVLSSSYYGSVMLLFGVCLGGGLLGGLIIGSLRARQYKDDAE